MKKDKIQKQDLNIVVIIQARMGSTRLPGKVLMDLAGEPMLWHIVSRVRLSTLAKKVMIATSCNSKDDTIEQFSLERKIDYYRGNEQDVLDRYYRAAQHIGANVIVRICADCPLIDPHIVDKTIKGYLSDRNKYDGSSNTIKRTFPRGLDVEAIPFTVLEYLWKNANQGYQREHVTPYMYEHPELFVLNSIENIINLSHLRWTVDEEDDLKFVREIYKQLYYKSNLFTTEDIVKLLQNEPNLTEINSHIIQKRIKNG